MSGTTTNGAPFATLADKPEDIPPAIQDLAEWTDAQLYAGLKAILEGAPAGDPTPSKLLTAGHVTMAASERKTILTSTFSLTRAQSVLVAAKARADNQSASVAASIGLSILIDGAVAGQGQAAAITLSTQGAAYDHANLVIPTFAVELAAGAHTIALEADRDAAAATIWVMEAATLNGRAFNPTSLSIIT